MCLFNGDTGVLYEVGAEFLYIVFMKFVLQGDNGGCLNLVSRVQFLIRVGLLAYFHCKSCCLNIERLVPLLHAAYSPPVKMLQLIHTAIYLSRIRIRFLLRSNAPIVVQEGIDSCTVRADHSWPWKHICCSDRSLSGYHWTMSENELVGNSCSHLQESIKFCVLCFFFNLFQLHFTVTLILTHK